MHFLKIKTVIIEVKGLVTWKHSFPLIFLWESRAIINNLDVILHGIMLQIIYTMVFRVKRLNNRTWRHAISHLGRWLLHGSLRVILLQPRFKVCNILYLRVLFHSSKLLLTFWYKKNAFMLQNIYTTVFRVQRLSNLTQSIKSCSTYLYRNDKV